MAYTHSKGLLSQIASDSKILKSVVEGDYEAYSKCDNLFSVVLRSFFNESLVGIFSEALLSFSLHSGTVNFPIFKLNNHHRESRQVKICLNELFAESQFHTFC